MIKKAAAGPRLSSILSIGQVIDVELTLPDKTRFQTPLVGVREGKYLVISQPHVARYGLLRDNIVENQQLVLRTICERTTGECLGFKSTVLSKLSQPDRLLFLSYPAQVEIFELRREKRLIVRQDALVFADEGRQGVPGMIVDLSSGGCRVELPLEQAGHCARERLQIEFAHPETGEPRSHQARVCSRQINRYALSLGLAFDK